MGHILSIKAIQSPINTGVDAFNRAVFSHNYRIQSDSVDVAQDVVALIQANGLGTFNQDLFIGASRSLSSEAETLVIRTGGYESRDPHNGQIIHRPTIQILVYNLDYDAASAKASAIYNVLNGKYNLTV
jgi:hypothetical protein